MSQDNMFERAARLKLRFPSVVGQLSVEELWSLPLQGAANRASLDSVAREINSRLKAGELSFVSPTPVDSLLQLSMDIVKHIIAVRMQEASQQDLRRQRAERKQQLLALIARKEEAALEGHSLEDLRKMAEEL